MATTPEIEEDDSFVRPEIVQRYLDKFRKATAGNIERHTKESLLWFQRRLSKDLNPNRKAMLTQSGDYKRRTGKENKTLIGRLFYFAYDAKEAGDKELGVFDQFPMIFIFNTSKSKDGHNLIHALNFHYLLPRERNFVFTKLLHLKNNKTWGHRTKLKLTWNLIKGLMSHKLYEKAVHAYRVDRIKSKLIEIYPEDWELAVFLRLERWQSISGGEAHQPSIRKAHRNK